MVNLPTIRKPSTCLCGATAPCQGTFDPFDAGQESVHGEVIITGTFNGLMERVAKIDFFDVWHTGRKIIKKAKKSKIPATMRMSEVLTLTGLTREDVELFTTTVPLIEIVEPGADPLLSFGEVYCLVKIFERMVDKRGELSFLPRCRGHSE